MKGRVTPLLCASSVFAPHYSKHRAAAISTPLCSCTRIQVAQDSLYLRHFLCNRFDFRHGAGGYPQITNASPFVYSLTTRNDVSIAVKEKVTRRTNQLL